MKFVIRHISFSDAFQDTNHFMNSEQLFVQITFNSLSFYALKTEIIPYILYTI